MRAVFEFSYYFDIWIIIFALYMWIIVFALYIWIIIPYDKTLLANIILRNERFYQK